MKKVNNFRKMGMVIAFIMICAMVLNPIATAQEFSDLRPDHWCYNKIIDFEERGYVTGYDDGEFKPDRTITRAEYVTIVNNFFGYDANTENTAKFSDVSEDDWFEPYVSEAVKRGYISGYPDGTFRPYEPIRRQEATVILSKILNIADEDYPVDHEDGLAQYDDGDEVEDWAYKAVHSYSVYNFINGYEDNTIRLFKNVTRAETVQLLNTVEEKVIIDRDNKTNEVKDRPSGHKKRAATPVITVVETNDTNAWYNKVEARNDGKVTVKVTTTTTNATITVKVNGEVIPTTPFETEGTGVTFDLPEGEYEIVATATRSKYKTSYEAKSNVDVDVTAPKVSGKVGDMGVSLSATDNLSGVDEIQYAWFVKDGTGYKRVSNWAELKDYVELPAKAQNYYIGVKGSDIAGNKIGDVLIDDNVDTTVTEAATNEPYEIVNEAKVIGGKDEEQNPEDEPQVGENAITYHKNDGTDVNYVQKLTADATVLKGEIFSRDQYKLIGWAEIATGNKVYDLGETVNFTENRNLYAVWQLNEPSDKPLEIEVKVSIKFVSGENGSLDGEANINVEYDTEWSTITVPTPKADTGYCFDKWTPELPTSESKVTDNAVYTANFVKDASQTKEISYTVEYYKDGIHVTADDVVVSKDVWVNDIALEVDEVNISNDKYTGYKFEKTEPSEIPTTIVDGGVIKVYYVKDLSQWYTVTFEAGENGTLEGTTSIKDILTGTEWETITVPTAKANNGYKFVNWTPSFPETITSSATYTANFEKDASQTKELSYKVEYYKDGTHIATDDVVVSKDVWVSDTEMSVDTSKINVTNKYTGYKFDYTEPSEIPATIVDGGVIKVYYVKDLSQWYTVTFEAGENGTLEGTTSIKDILTGTEWETITVPTAKANNGYKFVNWTPSFPETITSSATYTANFGKDASQTKELSYKVEYYKDGTHIATDDVVVSKDVWVNDIALEVDEVNISNDKYTGYKFEKTEPSEIPTTIVDGGVIKVYYVKDLSQWYTVTFEAGTNGTFKETELEYSDILEGTQLEEANVVIPTPKAYDGYEFDSWTPSEPTENTVVNMDLVFTANFKEIWQAPNVTIDKFVSTNVSNEEGNRAEPGTEIEYEVVITNNETEKDAIIDIDPERGMRVVSPESYENIELKPGESITVVVKKTVPKDYSIADDFDADIDVTIKSDKTESADKKAISESASNKIEKTTTIRSGEPIDKNIVLTIDVSGSMLYCCSHKEREKAVYRYDNDFVTPGGYDDVYYDRIDGYKWSNCPYAGHYYKISKDYRYENWVKCTDSSRMDVVKAALTSFVDTIYNASLANGEKITITLATFNSSAETSGTYLLTEENVEILKNIITSIDATGGTNIKDGIEKATKAYSNSSMLIGENVENYSIFFGDGKPSDKDDHPRKDDYTKLKNAVDYSYAIGFGTDFSNIKSEAYKILNDLVKGEGVEVTQAKTASDITNAFTNIATKIATSQQSNEGEIVLKLPDEGKYYPIIATYNNGEETIETLFTINKTSELEENDITIEGTTLTWNISGPKYSAYEGLSIKLGTQSPEEEIQLRSAPVMMLLNAAPVEINTLNEVVLPLEPIDATEQDESEPTEGKDENEQGETEAKVEGETIQDESEPIEGKDENEQGETETKAEDETVQDESEPTEGKDENEQGKTETKVEDETVQDESEPTEGKDENEQGEIEAKVEDETIQD